MKFYRILALLAILTTALFAPAADFNPWEGPEPMVVLMQTLGFGGGGQNPMVAIYEDGTIIAEDHTKTNLQYFTKKLSEEEMAEVRGHLKPLFELKTLKGNYDIVRMTDQPSASFYLKQEPRLILTKIEGLGPRTEKEDAEFPRPRSPMIDTLPNELNVFYKYLCTIQFPGTKEWIPKYFEIVTRAVDYSDRKKPAIPWPKDWPGFNSNHTPQRQTGTSIFIEGSKAKEIRDFFSSQPENVLFLIDGEKYSARYRPVFPNESMWLKTLFPGRIKD